MGDKDSLSKFRPAKGRRSFRSRSTKQKSEDADDDRQVGGITILSNFSSSGCCNKYSALRNSQKETGQQRIMAIYVQMICIFHLVQHA